MIVITGAYGFIGSCLAAFLNQRGFKNLILVDDFSKYEKQQNLKNIDFINQVERNNLDLWFTENATNVSFVFHLGARTDTTEFSYELLEQLNLAFSKMVWKHCTNHQIPLVYASSAATYGGGEYGYEDAHDIIEQLKPLNPYGWSKNEFDKWVLLQPKTPPFWAGLKFFNVYGPNEYHKGRMASVIIHFFRQIQATGNVRLFRSHHQDFADGEQMRDFIYVKDVLEMMYFLWENRNFVQNGIYNIGTGKARSFNDLAKTIFEVLGKKVEISYVDTPLDIRDKYQYFTQATMDKLRSQGYSKPINSLEIGIYDYVSNYLLHQKYMTTL